MAQESIAYHGIINLETPLIYHVKSYLEEREQRLARQISELISLNPQISENETVDIAKASPPFHFDLGEAVEVLGIKAKQRKLNKEIPLNKLEYEGILRKSERIVWDYFEALEACGQVLFEQVEQMSLNQWHHRLKDVVESIYKIVLDAFDRLKQVIKEIETIFLDFFENYRKETPLKKILTVLLPDKRRNFQLNHYIEKSEKFLNAHYKTFEIKYSKYSEMQNALTKGFDQLKASYVFKGIDPDAKENFEKLWKVLKMFELNKKEQAFAPEHILREVRIQFNPEKALWIFRTYFQALRETLFQVSRSLKHSNAENEPGSLAEYLQVVKGTHAECHILNHIRRLYEEAHVLTDPNPYVRTRLELDKPGFHDEESMSLPFVSFGYEVEKLDQMLRDLKKHLEGDEVKADGIKLYQGVDACQEIFHEMGHPLSTYSALETQAARLSLALKEMDELISVSSEMIEEMGKLILHGIRLDWRFHLLFTQKDFWDVLDVHQGLIGKSDDRQHFSRLAKMHQILSFINEGLKNQLRTKVVYELEGRFDELKESAQEFYHDSQAKLQKAGQDTLKILSVSQEISKELFELRILFGKFFSRLHKMEGDKRHVRYKLLFIDQYLDAVERMLENI